MPLSGHDHRFHFHFGPNREMTEIYASTAVKAFAVSLVGIFEAIYLFIYFGHSLPKTLVFFGFATLFFGLFSPLAGRLVAKIGIKHSILLSAPILFIYFLGLWKIEFLGPWFVLFLFFRAAYSAIFWMAFHTDFACFADKGKQGRELSYRQIVGLLSGAASPAISGIIITNFGFSWLFVLVLILLFVSASMMFFTKDMRQPFPVSSRQIYRNLFKPEFRFKTLSFLSEGFEDVALFYLWPLFLFLLGISFSDLGFITGGTMIISALFSIYIGRVIDRGRAGRVFKLGALLNFIIWPFKIFVTTPWTAFLASTLHSFSRDTLYLPLGTLFYQWSKEGGVDLGTRVVMREVSLDVARSIALFILAVIFYFVEPLGIRYYFIVAAFASLGMIFFIKKNKKQ